MYDMADREEAANSSAVNSTSHDDRWGGWDAGFSEAGFAIAGDTKCLIKKKKEEKLTANCPEILISRSPLTWG